MEISGNKHTELNPVQVSLLRLFSRPMNDEETLQIKRILVGYYSQALKDEVNEVCSKKGYSSGDFEQMLNDNS